MVNNLDIPRSGKSLDEDDSWYLTMSNGFYHNVEIRISNHKTDINTWAFRQYRGQSPSTRISIVFKDNNYAGNVLLHEPVRRQISVTEYVYDLTDGSTLSDKEIAMLTKAIRTASSGSFVDPIFAGDQEHQILRYVKFLRGRPRNRDGVKFPVLYLTPDGHSPSDDSTQADGMQCKCGVDYVCISYKDVIVPWLDKCINEMQEKPHMQEHLSTYRDIIRKKVLGMDRKKDIINIIERTEKNIKAAREISGQLDEIKIDAVTTFWRTIMKKLEGYGLRPEYCHFDANKKLMIVQDIEGLVRNYVDRPNEDNRYFGISVKLQNDSHVCLLVEENIYFAITHKPVDESSLTEDWNTRSERFAAWKYPYSGKKSLLSPDDDIWELACGKDRNTDAVSWDLISQLSVEFVGIVRKLG